MQIINRVDDAPFSLLTKVPVVVEKIYLLLVDKFEKDSIKTISKYERLVN